MDIINGGIYNGPINIASGESISIETAINELKEKLKTEIRYKMSSSYEENDDSRADVETLRDTLKNS